jgi:hypothetical protein
MLSSSKKQVAADCSNPLLHAGILHVILKFVGPGEALYIRCVDSSWRACYDKLNSRQHNNSTEHVHASTCTSYQAVFASASRVRAAHDCGLLLSADTVNNGMQRCAGKYGDISTLCVAQELGLVLSPPLMRGAASGCCLPKLQWLHTEQRCPLPDDITAVAARAGDVEMLRWLKSKGCSFNQDTFSTAAVTPDNLHVLQFLHDEGCPWHYSICGAAGEAGDLEQLKWLHAHGATLDHSTADFAAGGGAVHVFEWLQQQGVQFDGTTMKIAAMRGHLQLCQWLHAQQCPWNDSVTRAAALWSRCEVLQWLIGAGCPFSAHALCTSAVLGFKGSDFSVLQYLHEQAIAAEPAVLTLMLNAAGAHGKLAVAQWLRQRGAEWPAVLRFPSLSGDIYWHGDTLAWARAEGCTSPTE